MKVLVACEFSGIVRDAFRERGASAISCDLLPSERNGPHVQRDALKLLDGGWDLMIAFPPCTHLASSGARYFAQKRADGRQQQGIDFFMALARAPIPRIAIENPVGVMSTVWRKPDQIIEPWHFGEPWTKKTCLWLKGLPPLMSTVMVRPDWKRNPDGSVYRDAKGKRYSLHHYRTGRLPQRERHRERSRFSPRIAQAMARQWGPQ